MEKVFESIGNYLKATLLPYLIIWLKTENYLEYHLGNFIDPPPKYKRKENESMYLERITPRQAVRICRYNYNKWFYNNVFYHVEKPDLSMWDEESRKVLEKLLDTIFMLEDQWQENYKKALNRRMMEK